MPGRGSNDSASETDTVVGEVCRFLRTYHHVPTPPRHPVRCPCLSLPLPPCRERVARSMCSLPVPWNIWSRHTQYLPRRQRVATAYNIRILDDAANVEQQIDTLSPLSMLPSRLSASRPFSVPATNLSEPKQPSPTRAEWKTVVMSPKPWPPECPPASFPRSRSPTPTAAPGRASEEPSDGTEGSLSASLVTGAS